MMFFCYKNKIKYLLYYISECVYIKHLNEYHKQMNYIESIFLSKDVNQLMSV